MNSKSVPRSSTVRPMLSANFEQARVRQGATLKLSESSDPLLGFQLLAIRDASAPAQTNEGSGWIDNQNEREVIRIPKLCGSALTRFSENGSLVVP